MQSIDLDIGAFTKCSKKVIIIHSIDLDIGAFSKYGDFMTRESIKA